MPDPTVSIDEITTKSTIRRKVKQHQVKIVMQTDATKRQSRPIICTQYPRGVTIGNKQFQSFNERPIYKTLQRDLCAHTHLLHKLNK